MCDTQFPTQCQLVQSYVIKPSLEGQYWVSDLTLHQVVIILTKENYFTKNDQYSLASLSVDFRKMVPEIMWLMTLDSRPL